jgi:hypothetical protein
VASRGVEVRELAAELGVGDRSRAADVVALRFDPILDPGYEVRHGGFVLIHRETDRSLFSQRGSRGSS